MGSHLTTVPTDRHQLEKSTRGKFYCQDMKMVLLRSLLLPLLWSQNSCHARPNFFLNPSSILTKKTSSNFNIKAIYYEAHVFAPKQPKPFFDQGSVPSIYYEAPVFAPKQTKPSFDQGPVPSIYDEAPVFAPKQPKPSFDQGSVPSESQALEREKFLTEEYPLFEKVKETVRTLDTDEVEEIRPKRKKNPDNVKRVELILSEENYEELFARRHPSYTYTRFIQAIGIFPSVCSYVGREEDSDAICRKTLATMFAHFTQETGNHNPSDKEYDEWRQGLGSLREQGCTDTSLGCGYNAICDGKDSIAKKWACGKDRSGEWKKYYGRGAKQLSYNFNYGQFSQAMFGDRRLLLDHPDFVAETWLNMASATWFYATPQSPKPSMLHVIDGTWVPNGEDRRNGIKSGFGATINIINGGVECNTKDGRESKQARNRIEYYKQFARYFSVDYRNEELGCAKQQQFSAGGAGALPIYWDKDWSSPHSCKLVNYQTAHSALVQGEYADCVEENFNVKIK